MMYSIVSNYCLACIVTIVVGASLLYSISRVKVVKLRCAGVAVDLHEVSSR